MNVEVLNNIWNQIKLLKSDVYVVHGGLAIGATSDLNIIRCMHIYNPYNITISSTKGNIGNTIKGTEDLWYVPYFDFTLNNKANFLATLTSQTWPTISIDNLREDESFEGINDGWKTSNGVYKYTTNGLFVSLYKSLLSMNKSDMVQLNIYDMGKTFICVFTIFKKKEKTVINHYVNYLKV